MDRNVKIFELEEQINELKRKLAKTDYQAIKYAEGAISFADYADTLKARQEWRTKINVLETEIQMLRGK